jgi:hypothetical protein
LAKRLQWTLFPGKSWPRLRRENSENGSAHNSVRNKRASCRQAYFDTHLTYHSMSGLQIHQSYNRHAVSYKVCWASKRANSEIWPLQK